MKALNPTDSLDCTIVSSFCVFITAFLLKTILKLKVLECVNPNNFLMLYLLVFLTMSVAYSGAVFELLYTVLHCIIISFTFA